MQNVGERCRKSIAHKRPRIVARLTSTLPFSGRGTRSVDIVFTCTPSVVRWVLHQRAYAAKPTRAPNESASLSRLSSRTRSQRWAGACQSNSWAKSRGRPLCWRPTVCALGGSGSWAFSGDGGNSGPERSKADAGRNGKEETEDFGPCSSCLFSSELRAPKAKKVKPSRTICRGAYGLLTERLSKMWMVVVLGGGGGGDGALCEGSGYFR